MSFRTPSILETDYVQEVNALRAKFPAKAKRDRVFKAEIEKRQRAATRANLTKRR
jgi:hypothetical protein